MKPHYADALVELYQGDCLDVLRELPEASVDAVVTDPPYGIGFMGKEWDQPGEHGSTVKNGTPGLDRRVGKYDHQRTTLRAGAMEAGRYDFSANAKFQLWCEAWTSECLRVLKPGGHLLSFGGSRTWHRLAAAVEDAGFEIRDSIAWLYGSGFPKSLDVSKAIDKAAGAERQVIGRKTLPDGQLRREEGPGTRAPGGGWERPWQNDAESIASRVAITAPATEEAQQWQGWGTALKPAFEPIVVARKPLAGTVAANVLEHGTGALNIDACRIQTSESDDARRTRSSDLGYHGGIKGAISGGGESGRWPTNVLLDESQANGDSGGASRFFPVFRYQAKAPAKERPKVDGIAHPTVKPLELMRWLVRLVTPPGGLVLDPFAGSGTTGEACVLEGFRCLLIERESDYLPLIVERLGGPVQPRLDFDGAAS